MKAHRFLALLLVATLLTACAPAALPPLPATLLAPTEVAAQSDPPPTATQPPPTVTVAEPTAAATASASPTPNPARLAPDFTAAGIDGTTYNLAELRAEGQWVIVNFWATWCPPCVAEMPDLQRVADHRIGTHTLLGVNMNNPEVDVLAFVLDRGIRFPILLNPDPQFVSDYRVTALPQTVVIHPNGEMMHRAIGAINLAEFEAVLDDLLLGTQ